MTQWFLNVPASKLENFEFEYRNRFKKTGFYSLNYSNLDHKKKNESMRGRTICLLVFFVKSPKVCRKWLFTK